MPQPTLNELACLIAGDTTPSSDGACNQDRTNYICDVMGTDYIDLFADIDYTVALACDDPSVVQAGIHLAKLQMMFVAGAHLAGHVEKDIREMKVAWFDLMIRKMEWHLQHLKKDMPTPPFTFIQ